MQGHTADQLHIKVPHAKHPHAGLSNHGKGLGQQAVQRVTFGQALFEFGSFRTQSVIAQGLNGRLEGVDLVDGFTVGL